jgi:hypothetical protein
MATIVQAIEWLRGRGLLPPNGAVTAMNLVQRFSPTPRGSVRALLSKMLAEIAVKAPWAVILCRFKGDPPDPNREAPVERFFRETFTPGTGGLVEYWRDVFMGSVDIGGSRVFGWLEVDIARANAGAGSGVTRSTLVDAAISAAQRDGFDPLTGFHSQISVYTRNWSKDGAPPGADWRDPVWAPFWIDGSADGRERLI